MRPESAADIIAWFRDPLMIDVVTNSFPLQATIAVLLAFGAVAGVLGGGLVFLRMATPRGRKGSRPDLIHGPQESLDRPRGG